MTFLASLSLLQKLQYSSEELLLIGVKQSPQYFILLYTRRSILGRQLGFHRDKF
jgi:hypothetical protein